MPLVRNLKLISRNNAGQQLLTWDGVHNAHGYKLFKGGIKYLDVNSNRSIIVPVDSYLVYAVNWQNDESSQFPNKFNFLNYTLNFNFNYKDVSNVDTNRSESVSGIYRPRSMKQIDKFTSNTITSVSTTRFNYNVEIGIVSSNGSSLDIRLVPKVKVIANSTSTYVTKLDLPVANLAVT
jgi:hypothetical protein